MIAVAPPLEPGIRVRHYGQQYLSAMGGTATVLEAVPQRDGTYEYRVLVDEAHNPWGGREKWWASYHVVLAIGV